MTKLEIEKLDALAIALMNNNKSEIENAFKALKEETNNSNDFTCPECGCHNLTAATNGLIDYPVSFLKDKNTDDNGIVIDYTSPHVVDSEGDHFHCSNCVFIIQDKSANNISNINELQVWLKNHKK